MTAIGIGLGIFVWLVTGAIIGEVILHKKEAGIFIGFVSGVWAAWPFIHKGGIARYNFLHPVPKLYKASLKQAFSKVRQVLDEVTYNFGDKWHVSIADTQQHRIAASLRFTEEETKIEAGGSGHIHTRQQRVQRLIELDVQMKESGDMTLIQFDFAPRVEGMAFYACDDIIEGIVNRVENELGPGSDAGQAMSNKLPAPPWWLLGLTGLAVLSFAGEVMRAVFN